MKVEILLSTMYQTDFSFIDAMNVKTDMLIINQCDEEKIETIEKNGKKIRMIYTTERGLSKSRNMALRNAIGDICYIADDDYIFRDDFEQIVIETFMQNPLDDIITFCAQRYTKDMITGKKILKEKKYILKKRKYNYFSLGGVSSCEIAFRRDKIINNHIFFDESFGTGSAYYYHGEENIFLRDCYRKKLKITFVPKYVLEVNVEDSSWFNGFDEKFFFDTGAIYQRTFGKFSMPLVLLNVFRKRKSYNGRSIELFIAMREGVLAEKSRNKNNRRLGNECPK